MENPQTKNQFTIDHDDKYIPVVKTTTGEIQLSASLSIAEKTAILSDMDAKFITGDSCPKWKRWEKESYN